MIEANAVTDNPLVLSDGQVLSGGNFHAEPVAFAADQIALAICEIGAIAQRRIALLVDPALSFGLPAFLAAKPGLNSGLMIAEVTSAALMSENKQMAHPASVDSTPTSANQEDHVSMACHGARRLLAMTDNLAAIIGIEAVTAAQGLDFRAPLKTSAALQAAHGAVRGCGRGAGGGPVHGGGSGGGGGTGAVRGAECERRGCVAGVGMVRVLTKRTATVLVKGTPTLYPSPQGGGRSSALRASIPRWIEHTSCRRSDHVSLPLVGRGKGWGSPSKELECLA